jgi:flagellar basal body-associated protein FliL
MFRQPSGAVSERRRRGITFAPGKGVTCVNLLWIILIVVLVLLLLGFFSRGRW